MEEDKPIMNRLLRAIADSENDRPSDDSHVVDLSRKDALDAVKRITDLHIMASEYATALYELKPASTGRLDTECTRCGRDSAVSWRAYEMMTQRIAELEAARDRNHVLHLSALDKIAQVLTGRDPEEIAWWLRANHADYLADRPEGVRSKITAMAEACETKCTN